MIHFWKLLVLLKKCLPLIADISMQMNKAIKSVKGSKNILFAKVLGLHNQKTYLQLHLYLTGW